MATKMEDPNALKHTLRCTSDGQLPIRVLRDVWAMHKYTCDDTLEGDRPMCMLFILYTLVNSMKHTSVLGNTCAFQCLFLQ